jgi:hypothetical protein
MKHTNTNYIPWKAVAYIRCLGIAFAFLFASQSGMSQDILKTWQIRGSMGIYGDFYAMHADTLGAVAPRRPGTMARFVAEASISYGSFSLPVSLMLASGQFSVILPKVPRGNFLNYIKDPSNRVGIAPKYKWIQLLLGTQVPQYSALSVGDLPAFGAGINLTPGKFRFSAFAGTTQLAINEDTAKHIKGIYARKIYSGKIGVGAEDASHIYLIASVLRDDTSSLSHKPVNTMPQNGVLSSLDYKINLGKHYYIKGEVAGSLFTRDARSRAGGSFKLPFEIPSKIYTLQEASRLSFASDLSIVKEGKIFSIKANGKYIGDGFVPLGYPFMQTDRAEVTIDPSLNLFKSKVQLSGSIGKRIDNLAKARSTTTTQTLSSVNLNYQCTERLSLSGSFSNFGFRNPLVNDTFRVEMVTLSWNFSPVYTVTTGSGMHVCSGMFARNTFKDFNTISGALNDNDSHSAVLSYLFSKVKIPLTLSAMASYFDNNTSYGKFATKSLNLGAGYKFFKKKLNTMAGLTITESAIGPKAAGSQIMVTTGIKYAPTKKINLTVNGSVNLFKFGVTRPGISYVEDLLRTSLTYKF